MRVILLLVGWVVCIGAWAQNIPITVQLSTVAGAQTFYVRYGQDQNNLTNVFTIALSGTSSPSAFVLNVDSRKRWYVRQDVYTSNGYMIQGGAFPYGAWTNSLVTYALAAPTPDGPWTNYLTFVSAVATNQCGFYRLTNFMQR